ncbi:hypothetical protein D9M69_697230 [compost metagenome]
MLRLKARVKWLRDKAHSLARRSTDRPWARSLVISSLARCSCQADRPPPSGAMANAPNRSSRCVDKASLS